MFIEFLTAVFVGNKEMGGFTIETEAGHGIFLDFWPSTGGRKTGSTNSNYLTRTSCDLRTDKMLFLSSGVGVIITK